jgi:PAS domain S-box-containing protein
MDDLGGLFPFHLVFDSSLSISQVGPVLARICANISVGKRLPDHFRLLRPALPWSEQTINRRGGLFILEHIETRLSLRGEIRRLPTQGAYLFIGTPWITDLAELQRRGLSISDFPAHEPISDYLFLLQGKNTALAETERLTEAISAQKKELRIANRMLTAEFEVSQGLVEAKTLNEATETFLESVTRHLEWDVAALWICEPLQAPRCIRAVARQPGPRVEEALRQSSGLVDQARSRQELCTSASDERSEVNAESPACPFRRVLVIPLPGGSDVCALLQVFRDDACELPHALMKTLHSICARFGQYHEHQLAQAALADERARLSVVLSRTGAVIYSASYHDVRINFISDNVEQVLGYPKHALLGQSRLDLSHIHRDDRPRMATALAMLPQGPTSVDYRIRKADGTYQWRSDYLRLVYDEQKGGAEIFAASLDVSDRMDAEAALRDSEARLRAILDHAAEGILAIESDGTIELCNAVAASILGQSVAQILGQPLIQIPSLAALAQRSAGLTIGACALPSGVHELEGVREDGSSYALRLSVSEVRADGRMLAVAILRDLTDEKRAHRELSRAKALAESAYRAKSEFLAVVSHEIRTPLNVIIGMTELALGSKSPSEQQEFLGRVRTNADALLHLIHSMLDLSKIEASLMEIESIPFDCAKLIGEVADAVAARLMTSRVELISAVTPLVPSMLIGDPTRLRQVLMNLLGNASKFTEKGEVRLAVEVVAQSASELRLRFEVSDTGIGIPKEVQSRIFERFFQADSSTSRRFGGSGLGLTISRSLVSLMHGTIWFDSEPGCGSSFYFELPFGIAPPLLLTPPVVIPPLHILIADANPRSRRSMARVLSHRGFAVTEAPCAVTAQQRIEESPRPFAVVILDSNLQLPSGKNLATELVMVDTMPTTRLLLTTPIWATAPILPVSRQKSAEYLIRPVSNRRLLDAVERTLGLRPEDARHDDDDQASKVVQSQPFRILVVEDNIDNQRLAWHALSKAGYHPELAENGVIAVARTAERDYDLILMDIEMPELDGFSATAQIRKREVEQGRYRAPIIAVTAHAVPAFRQKCLDAGMDDYATKPIARQRLLDLANQWIDRRPVILAADDCPDGRVLLRELVRQSGNYRLVLAQNGQEAVELFLRLDVSLVLLDMEMPVLDGYAAARQIRELPKGRSVPIVAMTGHDGPQEVHKTKQVGCIAHLVKPVYLRDLMAVLERLIPKLPSQRTPARTAAQPDAPPKLLPSLCSPGFQPETVPPEILDLVPSYLARCRKDVSSLSMLLTNAQYAQIAGLAHKMKGTAPSYGFPIIGKLSGRLELAAQSNDELAAARVIAELQRHLAEIPSAS